MNERRLTEIEGVSCCSAILELIEEVRRLKAVEAENARLRRLLASLGVEA